MRARCVLRRSWSCFWISRCGRVGTHGRSRVSAVRCRSHRCRAGRVRGGSHGALRVQKVIVARSEAELNESARVGHGLRLPAMVALVMAQGVLGRIIPLAGRLTAEVVLADQGFLNGLSALGVNLLLSPRLHCFLPA